MSTLKRTNIIFAITITLMMIPWVVLGFFVLLDKASEMKVLDAYGAFTIFGIVGMVSIAANYIIGAFHD